MRRSRFNARRIEEEAAGLNSNAIFAMGPGPRRLKLVGTACFSPFFYAKRENKAVLVIPMTPNSPRIGEEYRDALEAWMQWLCTDFPLAHACLEEGATKDHCYEMDVFADTWEVHHWCNTARIPYEHRTNFRAWWKLVNEHRFDPNEAYLLCQCMGESFTERSSFISHAAISEPIVREVAHNFLNGKWNKKGSRWIDDSKYSGHGSMFGFGEGRHRGKSLYHEIGRAKKEATADKAGVPKEVMEDPFAALTVEAKVDGFEWLDIIKRTLKEWRDKA